MEAENSHNIKSFKRSEKDNNVRINLNYKNCYEFVEQTNSMSYVFTPIISS